MSEEPKCEWPPAKPPAWISTWKLVGAIKSLDLTFCSPPGWQANSPPRLVASREPSDKIYDPFRRVLMHASETISAEAQLAESEITLPNPNPFIKEE